MAENINISFAPNKAASDTQRITDLEQYVSTLTERTKFAFASVIEDYSESNADDNMKIINMIYQTACEAVSVGVSCGDGSSVWFNISAGGENQPGTNVDPNVSYSCIGGRANQAHTQCYAISIAGESNAAYASSFSSISGQRNTAKGDMYSTISGMDNTATSTTRCIISGDGNKVTNSDGSVVSGQQNTVTGNFSVIVANGAEVSGSDNIIVGEQHTVNGDMNAVFSNNNTVKGSKNVVSGDCNDVTDDNSVVLGTSNTAKNGSSYIVGSVNEVTGLNFVYGMGNTVSGAHNIAIGERLKIDNSDNINGYSRTAIGTYMDTEQLESYDGRWRFVIADGNYDNPHNLIYAIEDANGKRKLYFGCDIDLPSASDTALGAVKAGENISISADGTISVDLSAYLKSTDISEWAKQSDKPTYTANEIGLGNVDNTADADKPISTATQTALDGKADMSHKHTISDITDMPASLPASGGNADTVDGKHASDFAVAGHTHTAADVGAAAKSHTHTKSQITDFPTLGTAAGKNIDYFATASHKHTAADVGAATAADITAQVNAVSIGGRNLILNTNNMLPYAKSATVTISVDNEGYSVATFAKSEALNWYGLHTKPNIKYSEIKNIQVTISFEYRSDEWIENAGEHQYPVVVLAVNNISESSNDRVRWYTIYGDFAKPTASWQKYTKTVTITDSLLSEGTATITDNSWFFVQIGNHSTNNLQLRKIKMEKGNKPTDWTPAPEDAERRITSLEARVAALEAAAVSGGEV